MRTALHQAPLVQYRIDLGRIGLRGPYYSSEWNPSFADLADHVLSKRDVGIFCTKYSSATLSPFRGLAKQIYIYIYMNFLLLPPNGSPKSGSSPKRLAMLGRGKLQPRESPPPSKTALRPDGIGGESREKPFFEDLHLSDSHVNLRGKN